MGGEQLADLVQGLGAGLGLGLFAASRTRFEKREGLLYYIPHTYTGLLVTALFLGRLLYRLFELYATGALTGAPPANQGADVYGTQAMLHSPLTFGVFFVLIGYYVTYYCRLLLKSRHLEAGDFETAADTTPSYPAAGPRIPSTFRHPAICADNRARHSPESSVPRRCCCYPH